MGAKFSGNTTKRLLTWRDIESWQRDNEYILTGYRHASRSYGRSICSIFQLHNETTNIWTHLVGAGQFFYGLCQLVRVASLSSRNSVDIAAVALYYLCVVVCFVLSTIFHTFSDHSADMHRFGNELDHLGIVLVMWGTGISGAYFALKCNPALQLFYFLAVTATGLGCAVFTLRPKFRQPAYRTTRFLMYCFLGTSLFGSVVHGACIHGWPALDDMMGLRSFLGLATINFLGAAIYAARVPERWYPEVFDLLGQSHNWMHVLVYTGALVRLHGMLIVSDRWQDAASGFCR